MYIDPKIIRGAYIGKQLKSIFDSKGLTMSEIAEKIGTSQPNISNALNGKKSFSDNFFKKVGKAIGLSEKEITEIFKQADKEEFKYKYGEDIGTLDKLNDTDLDISILDDLTLDDIFGAFARKAGATDKEVLEDVKEYAKYRMEKGDSDFLKKLIRKK